MIRMRRNWKSGIIIGRRRRGRGRRISFHLHWHN
jgi:hypothetical protein